VKDMQTGRSEEVPLEGEAAEVIAAIRRVLEAGAI
jgi:hypothetical protein